MNRTERVARNVLAEFLEAKSVVLERIAVIGLGYVGLPVAVALAEKFPDVVGYDISERRVAALKAGHDWTGEIDDAVMGASTLRVTTDVSLLSDCSFFIVTVPTPINDALKPDLTPVESACRTIARVLRPGSVVVFESTVYPGVTEDICGPLLEAGSGLTCGVDFRLGYSPERINPGDREHRLEKIVKVVAGQDTNTVARMRAVYGAIIDAGLHEAPSIKVAEAAKVLENTQRDLNIALMNELALILDRMGVSTRDVLAAAGTKWNFLPFSPGLVGGHCIGVDPYYLTHASQQLGYEPDVILAGRRVNNGMGAFVAGKALAMLSANDIAAPPATRRIGVLGLTFKENVPDLRNSKVPDIVTALRQADVEVLVSDPIANPDEALEEYGIALSAPAALAGLDAVIVAVGHRSFVERQEAIAGMLKPGGVLIDVRAVIDRVLLPSGIRYWSL